jgi:hypothetical protein
MLAAASAAQYDGPAPEELVLAWDCQRWNTLPEPGGLWDQPAGLVERMNIALNVYDAFNSRQQAIINDMDLVKWTEKYPHAWKIVAHIERMRFDNNR